MPGNPLTDPNWAPNLAATIDKYVGMVRDKATVKVVVVVRALVFGLIVAVMGIALVVLSIILGLGLLQRLISLIWDRDSAVWISYVFVGGIFTLLGAFLMSRRSAPAEEQAR